MKLMIAMCLLTSVAMGQEVPAPAPGAVPSLVVSIVGQRGNSYDINVVNRSGHAVTAFALRLASADSRQNCNGPCGRAEIVADNARPVVKAGGSVGLSLGASRMNASMVVAEAAVFDDESYEGDERAAALLVAQQIGRQAEYDRVIAAVNAIMITSADDARKTTQIRIKLGELSVHLDPTMVQTFKQWFPALASCTKQYARFMKAAATNEKHVVTESMEQFAHGTAPGRPSLGQWWSAMQQQLTSFGCNGCAALAMRPKVPASSQNAARLCHEDITPILLTASLADDGSLVEVEEELEMEAELSEEDEVALDADAHVGMADVRMPSQPPARDLISPTTEASAKADVPAPLSPKPVAAVFPSGIPFIFAPDGGRLLYRFDLGMRPVPDYGLYRTFFRDLSSYGDMALYEIVRWAPNGNRVENLGPRAGGLNKAEITVLQQVATDTNQQLAVLFTKKETLLRAKLAGYPVGWIFDAPPIPELHTLEVEEEQALNTGIQRLRSRLGPASFARLDGFLRNVYHAIPGKLIRTPLTDDLTCVRFFSYLGSLDPLAERNLLAKQEEATRQNELRAVGLAEKDWVLLIKVAKDYKQLHDSLYNNLMTPGALALGALKATSPAGGAVGPERLLEELKQKHTEMMKTNLPASQEPLVGIGYPRPGSSTMAFFAGTAAPMQAPGSMAGTAGLSAEPSDEAEARRKEFERKHDEMDLALLSGIAQLQAGFGEERFQKFEAYLHKLYANAGFETAVPIEEKAEKLEAQGKK